MLQEAYIQILFSEQQQHALHFQANNMIQIFANNIKKVHEAISFLYRLPDATDSAEKRYLTRERTESCAGSYGWSFEGISSMAGTGLL
jgi:hypothetical protein